MSIPTPRARTTPTAIAGAGRSGMRSTRRRTTPTKPPPSTAVITVPARSTRRCGKPGSSAHGSQPNIRRRRPPEGSRRCSGGALCSRAVTRPTTRGEVTPTPRNRTLDHRTLDLECTPWFWL